MVTLLLPRTLKPDSAPVCTFVIIGTFDRIAQSPEREHLPREFAAKLEKCVVNPPFDREVMEWHFRDLKPGSMCAHKNFDESIISCGFWAHNFEYATPIQPET